MLALIEKADQSTDVFFKRPLNVGFVDFFPLAPSAIVYRPGSASTHIEDFSGDIVDLGIRFEKRVYEFGVIKLKTGVEFISKGSLDFLDRL